MEHDLPPSWFKKHDTGSESKGIWSSYEDREGKGYTGQRCRGNTRQGLVRLKNQKGDGPVQRAQPWRHLH